MYLDYRNKTYKLVRDGDEWEIISNDVRSIMDGFRKDGNIYYKQINNQKLLNTRYDIEIHMIYRTNYELVSNVWKVKVTPDLYNLGKIKIVFAEGLLPGWNVEDKNVCYKYIDITEVEDIYFVKLDMNYNEIEKKRIDINQLKSIIEKYS